MKLAINVALFAAGADVSTLALVDNGVGWEAVCERKFDDGDYAYDIWFGGEVKYPLLRVREAALVLAEQYAQAKRQRIAGRLI